jgi:uncharacterized protein GlcG (DUF336 family)
MTVGQNEGLSISKRSIGAAAAHRAIEAGLAKAAEMGMAVTVAVVDESGVTTALARMDGASTSSVELAVDKAYTVVALGFGASTAELFEIVKNDEPLHAGMPARGRFVFFGGGSPIRDGEQVIGAVGVSGGHYSEDVQVAEAAVAALA